MPRKRILSLYLARRSELVNYAGRITGDRAAAEDIVQEAWTRIDAAREADQPAGYLFRTVRNLALDCRRRRGFEQRHFMEGAEQDAIQTASDAPSPETAAISRDELRIVQDALAGMPENMRIAVEMHRIGGAKLKDIAACLDVSVTTAHQLVADGVQRCKTALRRQA